MNPKTCRHEIRVRFAETDQMGVVYHANYLVWCEIGRTELMRHSGYRYSLIEERGFSLAVADAVLRYHAPARYDDTIYIDTRITSVRSRTVEFEYLISKAETGQKLATASTTLVCLNRDSKVVSIPDDIRELLHRSTT